MSEREEYFEDLSAYLDGELGEVRRRRLYEALQDDQDLARELDRLRATREFIRALPTEEPPKDFVPRVMARGERMRLLAKLRQPRSYRWITLAAAAVVLVAAGVGTIMILGPHLKEDGGGFQDVGRLARAPEGSPEINGKPDDEPASPGVPKKTLLAKAPETPTPRLGTGAPVTKFNGRLEETLDRARLAATKLKKSGTGDLKMVIYTDNLAFAQRDIEKVLVFNGIEPVRSAVERDAVPGKRMRARGNFFNKMQATPTAVTYEVFLPLEQAPKVQEEVDVVRARQMVSQLAVAARDVGRADTPRPAGHKFRTYVYKDKAEGKAADRARGKVKGTRPAEQRPDFGAADAKRLATGDESSEPAVADDRRIAKAVPKAPSEKVKVRPAKPSFDTETEAVAAKTGAKPIVITQPALGPATRPDGQELAEAKHLLRKAAQTAPAGGDTPEDVRGQIATGVARTRPSKEYAPQSKPRDLAMRQQTSQPAEPIRLEAGADVTRLLITLNYRSTAPRPTTNTMMKAADKQTAPPTHINGNEASH